MLAGSSHCKGLRLMRSVAVRPNVFVGVIGWLVEPKGLEMVTLPATCEKRIALISNSTLSFVQLVAGSRKTDTRPVPLTAHRRTAPRRVTIYVVRKVYLNSGHGSSMSELHLRLVVIRTAMNHQGRKGGVFTD